MKLAIAFTLWAFLPGPKSTALDAAIGCYQELDYACTESRLSEALSTNLTKKQRIQAYLYKALVATAWREPDQARRAVRSIYALNPKYAHSDVPNALAKIFADERPKPPPKPRILVATDYRYTRLLGSDGDASWWLDGQGASATASLLLKDKYGVGLRLSYVEHTPSTTTHGLVALSLWSADLLALRQWRWDRVGLRLSGAAGVSRVDTEVVAIFDELLDNPQTAPFYATQLGVGLECYYLVWRDIGIGLSTHPTVLIRSYKDQPHLSYLLPIQVGLRYGR